MCTWYLHYIHPPYIFPLPTGTIPPGRTCSDLLFYNICKKKKKKNVLR
jgi:hypothetical protein